MGQPQKSDLTENEKKIIDKCGQGEIEIKSSSFLKKR